MSLEKIHGHAVTYVPPPHQVDRDSLLRKHAFYVLKISLSIFRISPVNDGNQHCSSRSSAALPAQTKSNTGETKRERWANKEAKSLGVRELGQSSEDCSSGQDWCKVFLLLYEMLQEYGTHLVEAAWAHQVYCFLHLSVLKNYPHYD
jgi:tRNA guanosine-2'-O-methyltransferase